jgi:hypothetical protein
LWLWSNSFSQDLRAEDFQDDEDLPNSENIHYESDFSGKDESIIEDNSGEDSQQEEQEVEYFDQHYGDEDEEFEVHSYVHSTK